MSVSPRTKALLLEASTGVASSAIGAALAPSVGGLAALGVGSGLAPASAGALAGGLSSAAGGLLGAVVVAPAAIGLTNLLFRTRFPQLPVGAGGIGEAVVTANELRSQGLQPQFSTDPFTGNLAISTQNQSAVLPTLLFESAAREALQATETDVDVLRELRDAFIAERASSSPPLAPSSFPVSSALVQEFPGGPFRFRLPGEV